MILIWLELFCSANNPQEVVNVIVDSQDMTGHKGTGLVDLRTVPEVIQAADEDVNVTIIAARQSVMQHSKKQ